MSYLTSKTSIQNKFVASGSTLKEENTTPLPVSEEKQPVEKVDFRPLAERLEGTLGCISV